jgi:hypothetical protein
MIETILVTRQPSYGWVQHSGPSSGMFFHFPLEALSFFFSSSAILIFNRSM